MRRGSRCAQVAVCLGSLFGDDADGLQLDVAFSLQLSAGMKRGAAACRPLFRFLPLESERAGDVPEDPVRRMGDPYVGVREADQRSCLPRRTAKGGRSGQVTNPLPRERSESRPRDKAPSGEMHTLAHGIVAETVSSSRKDGVSR